MKKTYFKYVVLLQMMICLVIWADVNTAGAQSKKTEVTASVGNLYEKPDKNAAVVTVVKRGVMVSIIEKIGDWYVIKLPDNRLAWGNESLFPGSSEGSGNLPEKQMVVRVPQARVRELPTTKARIVFGITAGQIVDVLEVKDKWYQIRTDDGKTGWSYHTLFNEKSGIKEKPGSKEEVETELPVLSTTAEKPAQTPSPLQPIADLPAKKEKVKQPVVRKVGIEKKPDGMEEAVFMLNGYFPPKTFVIEDDVHKIVCDFAGAVPGTELKDIRNVNGKVIQGIRIGIHGGKNAKVRVVLDLVPSQNYNVEQVFYEKENFYVLKFKPSES